MGGVSIPEKKNLKTLIDQRMISQLLITDITKRTLLRRAAL